MATADSVRRNVVRRSSLEDATRIYLNLIQETTANNGFNTPDGKPYPFFVPSTVKSTLGSPTALAIGAFATTLTTLSLALMGWRNITVDNVFIGNFFSLLVLEWSSLRSGNWYLEIPLPHCTERIWYADFLFDRPSSHSSSGFFYGGFGAIITAFFGVKEAYGDDTVGYNNSLGFFVMWAMLNLFFLFGSLPINLVYIGIFFFVELAASYFATADGYPGAATALQKAGGVFAFLAGLLGYYTVAHLMCQTALFFGFQWGIQGSATAIDQYIKLVRVGVTSQLRE
ncbi:uncharacterized protein LY89DRAFT_736574 [Mollisia scopiformis]|uniref:Uncharacterized protein n=1 Tax=Mollisia scopiformis TaxID=149040 RepID=A0A194X2Y2_MOLSC|nr:uncharacterized protein LY89DRAFT_736574 [Mollisia scopiformis]KUJ14543.1 hypothetical protein LY89DRAFT_736574 [Mollisia scopiformis]